MINRRARICPTAILPTPAAAPSAWWTVPTAPPARTRALTVRTARSTATPTTPAARRVRRVPVTAAWIATRTRPAPRVALPAAATCSAWRAPRARRRVKAATASSIAKAMRPVPRAAPKAAARLLAQETRPARRAAKVAAAPSPARTVPIATSAAPAAIAPSSATAMVPVTRTALPTTIALARKADRIRSRRAPHARRSPSTAEPASRSAIVTGYFGTSVTVSQPNKISRAALTSTVTESQVDWQRTIRVGLSGSS